MDDKKPLNRVLITHHRGIIRAYHGPGMRAYFTNQPHDDSLRSELWLQAAIPPEYQDLYLSGVSRSVGTVQTVTIDQVVERLRALGLVRAIAAKPTGADQLRDILQG